ncbi:MAG: hypothetical protein HC896_10535 [Bacteroidales bacterium]|nr:hypothetical protein [Bacteroidales bacterium]
MKKIKFIALSMAAGLFMTSCVLSHTYQVTGAPVGTKTGVAKAHNFQSDMDFSIKTAAENGGITRVGSVEVKITQFIIPFFKTTVTGE